MNEKISIYILACASAIRLLAHSKHFASVIDRFLKTAQGRVMRTESQVMKVLFGSAVTERENLKCTCFQALSLIFNTMIEKKNFDYHANCTSFILEASKNSEPETWASFFEAIASSAKASMVSGKDFVGRNEILQILCKEILPSESHEKLHSDAIVALSSMLLSKVNI